MTAGAALRVLLVEDDPAYARLVREYVRAPQLATELELVATASSLAEAIAAARGHAPDVVFLDLGLPDHEGVATLTAFRAAHPRLPVVVLSGLADIEVALEAMRDGAQEYLVKGQAESQLFPRAARSAIERKRLQELEQLLIGVVSHDLRGPLQTVSLNCELAIDEAARTATPLTPRVGRALAAARRALGLVNDLLDATRARLGSPLPVERTATDLVPLCAHLVQEVAAGDRAIRFEAPASLVAQVDGPRIAQVLSNLLGNALQHGAAGSPIAVWLTAAGDQLELGVHNTGAPIPDVLRGKLFEPLERSQLPSRHHSIGLGLYIVHEIVKAHGGAIDVSSSADAGTTFRVRLPLR
ncbi:MAG TPA: ATP-binding protein [Kofleriaceae bacterium]|nr:ATP-binding protein [Kofleriaceae bacterium]